MSDSQTTIKPPPIGSFPFFEETIRFGKTLSQLWLEQGSIWNDQWGKLKGGTYQATDWYSAMVRSTELTTTALGDLFTQLTGEPTPPWKSLNLETRHEVRLITRVTLGMNETISVSELSLLGNPQKSAPRPVVEATRVRGESRLVLLTLQDPVPDIAEGQYIGFVMRSSDPAPIAIVTVTKPSLAVSHGGAKGEAVGSSSKKKAKKKAPSKKKAPAKQKAPSKKKAPKR